MPEWYGYLSPGGKNQSTGYFACRRDQIAGHFSEK
jgi:hypothetical protein